MNITSYESSPLPTRRRRAKGFTIIELMVTIAVVGVLSATTIPALGEFLRNSGLKSTAFDLVGAITMARSEAVKRGSRTVMCRSEDPYAAEPVCGGGDNDWSTGWLVFIDEDNDDDFEVGTDILLTVGEGAPEGIDLHSNDAADAVLTFRPDGSIAGAATARFALCDLRGAPHGKLINVTRVGRPDIVSGTTDDPISSCTPT